MYLVYKDKEIRCVETGIETFLRYKVEKIYYAVVIRNCNRFSTILSLQNIDIMILDNDYKILSYKHNMKPNTVFEDKNGSIVVVLPPNYYENIEIGDKIVICEKIINK